MSCTNFLPLVGQPNSGWPKQGKAKANLALGHIYLLQSSCDISKPNVSGSAALIFYTKYLYSYLGPGLRLVNLVLLDDHNYTGGSHVRVEIKTLVLGLELKESPGQAYIFGFII